MQYFELAELKCKCGKCGSTGEEMKPDFMRKLIALREHVNFPFLLISAYRCPQYNLKVSSTGEHGPHTTGRAVDISARGDKAFQIVSLAADFGFTGIGVNQKGLSRIIHLDDLQPPEYPRPFIWSY